MPLIELPTTATAPAGGPSPAPSRPPDLMILYRGPLSSCNYGCEYCPFAKRQESDAELAADRAALERFVAWVAGRPADRLTILFTPWGEALVRPWYQSALTRLSAMPHIARAVIQTNLACRLDWIEAMPPADRARLGLWTTFHPSQASRRRFVEKCGRLDGLGVRYSVGVVGLAENIAEAEALRRELPAHVYVWVNAYKRTDGYYDDAQVARLAAVDPLFRRNNTRHPSRGRECRTGHTAVSVDGDGVLRRCHFVRTPIGNIYEPGWEAALRPRPCPNDTCGCHIGYVHMPELGLYEVFGAGLAERIPAGFGPPSGEP
jgi:hypothetical protein